MAVDSKDVAMLVDKLIATASVVVSVCRWLAVDVSDRESVEPVDSGMASVDDKDVPKVDDEIMLMGTGRHGPALAPLMASVTNAVVKCLKATIVATGNKV